MSKTNNTPVVSEELDFEPMWDFILFEPIENNKTSGGIILPDGTTQDNCRKGRVVKAGTGDWRNDGTFVQNPIKVGDVIYFLSMRKPFQVVLNNKLYLCLSGKDCVALAKNG